MSGDTVYSLTSSLLERLDLLWFVIHFVLGGVIVVERSLLIFLLELLLVVPVIIDVLLVNRYSSETFLLVKLIKVGIIRVRVVRGRM